MQYVRCEACGAKALLAASRCPKCAHPLELRDHHGEFVALTHCRKCDTWYPTSRGGCKWCGTKPGTGASPRLYTAIAAAVLVAGLGWWAFVRQGGTPEAADSVAAAPPAVDSLPSVAAVTVTPDTTAALAPATVPQDSFGLADTVSTPAPQIAPPVQPATPAAAGAVQAPTGFTRSGYASPDTYINLRAEPDRAAAIVGTINPGTQVETGARFRRWRQVRTTGGQVGWVDPRHLIDVPR